MILWLSVTLRVYCNLEKSDSLRGLSKSKSKSYYNRQSVGQFVLVSRPFWSKWPDVTFIWVTITFFIFHVGHPLWWEDGSVICSAMRQIQFQVTLRPTVCRPVRLGTGPPMGPINRFSFLCLTVTSSSRCRAPSPISPWTGWSSPKSKSKVKVMHRDTE
jgi:hypothetical protein